MALEYGEFAAVYDRLMTDVDYKSWSAYICALLKSGGILPGSNVLDCACGTGEITLRLQKEGYLLTGSDRSEQMLAIAQQKARKAGQKIPFICQDMQRISLHKPVSAINCSCDGVNYLLSNADINAFLRSANRALKDGGTLLLQEFLSGFSYLERRLRKSRFSFWSLSTLRFRLTISVCCASMVSRIDCTSFVRLSSIADMSVTCSFIGIKVRKISDMSKCFGQ